MVVAKRTGLSLLTINVVENDRYRGKGTYPDLETLLKLVAELRVPITFSERGRTIVMQVAKPVKGA